MNIDKRVFHVSEAACLLACSAEVIYHLIHTKALPAYKTGKAWKIPEESIRQYITARTTGND